jgi:hypothetical protein
LLLPFALALGWATLPLILPSDLAFARWAAPGVFAPSFVILLGILVWIPIGAIMGARPRVSQRSIDLLLVLVVPWVIMSLVAYRIDPWHVWGIDLGLLKPRFSATLLNPNAAACAMAMMAVLAASRFMSSAAAAAEAYPRQQASALAMLAWSWLATMLAFIGMVLAGSRLAIVLAVMGLMFAVTRAAVRAGSAGRYRRQIRAASILVLLFPLAIGATLGGARLAQKMGSVAGDASLRWDDLKWYTQMSFDAPWFGYGLGGFRNANIASLDASHVLHRWNFGAAHNVVLHGAIEGGWPFALLSAGGIVLAAAFVLRARRLVRLDTLRIGLMLAVGIALFGGLSDIALNVPALASFTAWLGGLLLGGAIRAVMEEVASRPAHRGAG